MQRRPPGNAAGYVLRARSEWASEMQVPPLLAPTQFMRVCLPARLQGPRPVSFMASSPGNLRSSVTPASGSCAAISLKWAPSSGAHVQRWLAAALGAAAAERRRCFLACTCVCMGARPARLAAAACSRGAAQPTGAHGIRSCAHCLLRVPLLVLQVLVSLPTWLRRGQPPVPLPLCG